MKGLLSKFYIHLYNNYTAYSFAANIINAIALAGLLLLGVLSSILTVAVLVTSGVGFSLLYFLGKWLDQEVDDIDKIKNHNRTGESK